MPESPEDVKSRLAKQLADDIANLSTRRDTGLKAISMEQDIARRKVIQDYWNNVDAIYKRLIICNEVLVSSGEAPLLPVYCAICRGLVKPEELLDAGFIVPVEEGPSKDQVKKVDEVKPPVPQAQQKLL